MSDDFRVLVEKRGDLAVLRTEGYINNVGGEEISVVANGLIDEGILHLVLNLEKSNVVNSIGISILIEVIERIVELEGKIAFCHLTNTIAKTFNIMGLTQYAEIYASETEAEAGIKNGTPTL